MQDVLKEVEVQEPRFISSLTEINGRYEGFDVVSPNEFEVVLYLNQMGVFNFVDDGSLPGMITLETWAECQAQGCVNIASWLPREFTQPIVHKYQILGNGMTW